MKRFLPLLVCASLVIADELPEKIEFNEHIRPILSDKCFHCHGNDPETAEAGLLLNSFEGATKKLSKRKEKYAIVPGNPDKSTLIERIYTDDEDDIMPPLEMHKTLTKHEKGLLKKWISQGAEYQDHWSFTKITNPPKPQISNHSWPKNDIDSFVLKKLEDKKLTPNKQASKEKLLRRLSFDTTGLPPSLEEIDRFLKDDSSNAYEKQVDTFLAKSAYGEHMARFWLDAARYGDTHGLHLDNYREMWPYRDWVIKAFNQNMPFDQFSTEQLAGDLLPQAKLDQKVASGFNRCNVTTSEGGSIDEEYYVRYAVDRTSTTSTVWLGLTTACAACHDHKFDPVSQKEFYQMTGFFNNITENAMDGNKKQVAPIVHIMNADQEKQDQELKQQIANIKTFVPHNPKDEKFLTWLKNAKDFTLPTIADPDLSVDISKVDLTKSTKVAKTTYENKAALEFKEKTILELSELPQIDTKKAFSFGAWIYPAQKTNGAVISKMDNAQYSKGWDLWLQQGKVAFHLINEWPGNALKVETKKAPLKIKKWNHVYLTSDGSGRANGIRLYINGMIQDIRPQKNTLTKSTLNNKPITLGGRESQASFLGKVADITFYNRELSPIEVTSVYGSLPIKNRLTIKEDPKEEAKRKKELYTYYRQYIDQASQQNDLKLRKLEQKHQGFLNKIPTTLVMEERQTPRGAYVLDRGLYDQRKEKVEPGVPVFLPPLPEGPANRLTFAKWLFLPDHPLTARVTVNRFWQQLFGTGLSKTAGDFGSQGEFPANLQLLDHLAYKFKNEGWDIKKLMKYMLMSAAYQQDSSITDRKLQIDPYNRLISRGPRFRLDSEMIRDNALKASGLMVNKIGGPSVKPYQPTGVWNAVAYSNSNTRHFKADSGDGLYRRSLYTFLKRTAPPPMMSNFDAPNRETCSVSRERTNTPLQALQLMNDTQYLEASRVLAETCLKTTGSQKDKLTLAFRKLSSRQATPAELELMSQTLLAHQQFYQNDTQAAQDLISHGESKADSSLAPAELAAWTMLCSQLLNLDEVITKE